MSLYMRRGKVTSQSLGGAAPRYGRLRLMPSCVDKVREASGVVHN